MQRLPRQDRNSQGWRADRDKRRGTEEKERKRQRRRIDRGKEIGDRTEKRKTARGIDGGKGADKGNGIEGEGSRDRQRCNLVFYA